MVQELTGCGPNMAYNVAANMQPVNFIGNMLAARQQEIGNSLAQREMGMLEQNALMQRQQFDAQNQQRQAAQKEQEQAAMREWVINGAKHLASAKSEQEFAMLADRYASDPRTQQLGITRDQITPDGVSQILMAVGGAPVERQVPFEQSEAYLMEQLKASNARRLEMLKQRGDSAPKPVKQEVITRPAGNGMLQDFAYDPANPGARVPVGAPYKQGSSKADEADTSRSQALALYETARDGLIAGLEGTSTGPIAGRIPAFTAGQQTAEGGVAAMAPVLKQLFRVSGEGVFTDKDQQLLLDMVPKRTDLPESRKAKIENIDKIVKAKLGIGQSAGGKKVISFSSLGK